LAQIAYAKTGLPRARGKSEVVLRLHEVTDAGVTTLAESRYLPGDAGAAYGRVARTFALLDELKLGAV